jgi:hypothetical protein
MHIEILPSKKEIESLSRLAPGYPVNVNELVCSAREHRFGQEMVSFLSLFSMDRTFNNEEEFMAEAMALELFESEIDDMPREMLRSSMD